MTESEPDRNRDPGVPPPASTEWSHELAEEGGDLPLPPFFAGGGETAPAAGPEPVVEAAPQEAPWEEGAFVESEAGQEQPFPFEDMGTPGAQAPGSTEPPFAEEPETADLGMSVLDVGDIKGTEGTPNAEEAADDFPAEAFHLPERNLIDEPVPAAPDRTAVRALDLAERLDRLAGALRSRGTAALTEQLAGGDRFDALLTGLLAGFLAAGDE